MSALFPTDTNEESPIPRRLVSLMTARPTAPLCDRNPTVPGSGVIDANVPFRATSGSVLITPMQFGPTSRIPHRRHTSTSSRCRLGPSPPVSPNPAEMTTSPRTPLRPHASATSMTNGALTAMNATSTGPGTSSIVGYAFTPCTAGADGFTG